MSATISWVQMDASVIDFLKAPKKMLIDGEWVEAVSGKTFATYNPATHVKSVCMAL